MSFSPMLAHSAPATPETITRLQGTHWFSLKIDGVRGIIALNDGSVKITNRNGVDISPRYPELIAAVLDKFGMDTRLILDGEITVLDPRGLPSFKLTSKRDRQQKPAVIAALSTSMPVTFIAFDVLYTGFGDQRARPFTERHALLETILDVAGSQQNERIRLNIGSTDGAMMMAMVTEFKLEGLVAKELTSPYQSGRRSSWLKIKPIFTASVVITGREQGEGSRSDTFGALTLGMYDGDTLVPTGKVGSGFTQADLAEIVTRLDNGETLVAEVSFVNLGDNNNLRFPVYLGLRTDVAPADCQLKQLVDVPRT